MRFGIRLIEYHGDSRRLVGLAAAAERAGADQVWFPHDPFMRHTWALAAAAAEHTKRVGLGGITINPYTSDPFEVATYLATLDELSGGRALVGFGLHTDEMLRWVGYDPSDHLVRTREAVELIRRLLRGDVVRHEGDAFHWSDAAYLRFDPLRDRIPIYVACFGEEFLRLSGEIGDGSLPMVTPPESAAAVARAVRAGAEAAGRDPEEVDIAGCMWLSVADDGAAAKAFMRKMVAYFGPYLDPAALALVGVSRDDFREIKPLVEAGRVDEAAALVTDDMLRLAIVGTPDQVVERLAEVRAAGITQANLGGPLGPDADEALRLLGERVFPALRDL
jgi:5,10-methylenetetrahydromethanopterin reductase